MSRLHATETQCLRPTNNECQNYLAFFGQSVTSTMEILNITEKQQTVHKFVQQCCFFQSKAITSKFADQADNIAHFKNPFFFLKE